MITPSTNNVTGKPIRTRCTLQKQLFLSLSLSLYVEESSAITLLSKYLSDRACRTIETWYTKVAKKKEFHHSWWPFSSEYFALLCDPKHFCNNLWPSGHRISTRYSHLSSCSQALFFLSTAISSIVTEFAARRYFGYR